ncbi:type IV pilus assembly protein PilM [Patescibacteria group bacterium]|nr:type IV pilus assembly protein PilM [Patescibacteria group bacterium]
MGIFGGTKLQTYLGVDIGAGGIKIVELANEKGRARLVTYGFAERLPEQVGPSPLDQPQETAALIKKIIAKAKCGSKRAITGIPVSNVFSSVLSLNVPVAKKKELDAAIKLQAKKITPRPLEEMVLDYKIIEEGPKTTKVLLTAAEAVMVRKYVEIFKLAGLELISLETEPLALIRSLIGRDLSTIVLVDIGAMRTSISVIEKGVPAVSRSIDVGGLSFTRAIASQMQMPLPAAEQMKHDIGSLGGMLPEQGLPKVMEQLIATIVNELRYVFTLYTSQQGWSGKIEKLVLTGGGAPFPRLAETIGSALGFKTYVGDPWARVVYPEELRPFLDEIGPRFSVAIGLGMRDIE